MILPMLWLRLVVVIGFTIFVAIQQMWLITAIGVVLTLLIGYQINLPRLFVTMTFPRSR